MDGVAAEWIVYGGMMLIPIGLASLLGVTLIVAKWLVLREPVVLPTALKKQVLAAVDEEAWGRAGTLCAKDSSALARIYEEGLRFRGASRAEVRLAIEEVGRREVSRLERFVGAVGALASVTPLMGLLGTVIGMIRVFQVVVEEASATGMADPTLLAGGIWEALVTTAAGLCVAIPLYLGYRYLLGTIDAMAIRMEEASKLLLDRLAPPPVMLAGDEEEECQNLAAERLVARESAESVAVEGL